MVKYLSDFWKFLHIFKKYVIDIVLYPFNLKLLAFEETIHDMQQKKRHLIEGLLTEKRFSKLNLSRDDLEHFFRPI